MTQCAFMPSGGPTRSAQYRGNINHDPPFDRKPGEQPRLSEGDIDDIVAFLNTLTDGYKPQKLSAAHY